MIHPTALQSVSPMLLMVLRVLVLLLIVILMLLVVLMLQLNVRFLTRIVLQLDILFQIMLASEGELR